MKLLVIAVLCCVMVSVTTIKGMGNKKDKKKLREGFCHTSEDCHKSECCIMRGMLGGIPGRCEARAKEGESCSFKFSYAGIRGKKYVKYCPCEDGLVCELDEPKKKLQRALIFDIYNTCLNKTEIKFIEIEKEKEIDNNTETASAYTAKGVKTKDFKANKMKIH